MKKKLAIATTATLATASQAFAAVPTNVSDGVTGAATDAAAVGALAFLVYLGVWAIKRMKGGL